MTDDVPATDEAEDDASTILSFLVAERTDSTKPNLSVADTALLHMAAQLLAAGDPTKARDVTELLDRSPKVIRPGAKPEPTLAQACKPDAPWNLSRLSNQQLLDLEVIASVAQGRACTLPSPRMEAILDLALHLDGAGEPDLNRVRQSLGVILAPKLTLDAVHPSHAAELSSERSRRVALEEDVRRLSRVVAEASLPLPANVVKLRTAAAASAVSAPAVPHGFVDDYSGHGS
jgi:hypothetical protein